MCLRYYIFPDVSRMRLFRNRFVRGSVGAARPRAPEIGRRNSEPRSTPLRTFSLIYFALAGHSLSLLLLYCIVTSWPCYNINTRRFFGWWGRRSNDIRIWFEKQYHTSSSCYFEHDIKYVVITYYYYYL